MRKNEDCYAGYAHKQQYKINFQFRVFKNAFDFAGKSLKIKAEIDAKQNEKYGDYVLREGMEQLHTAGDESKTARARASEGGEHAEKQMLAFITGDRLIKHQYDDFENRHSKIDEIKDSCCHLHLGNDFTDLRSCTLSLHKVECIRR